MASAQRRVGDVRRWAAALLVLLVGAAATTVLAGFIDASQRDGAQADADRAAAQVAGRLANDLLPAAQLTHAMDAYVVSHMGAIDQAQTVDFMDRLLEQGRLVRSISIAPDNVLRYVEPLAGNEAAIGLDLEAVPEQWEPVKAIIASGRPALVGPFPLVQGGQGLAYRHPVVLVGTGYWGLVSTVVDADEYLAAIEAVPGVEPTRFALRAVADDGTTGAPFWGSPAVFDASPTLVEVTPLGATWQLAYLPEPTDSLLATVVRILGYGVSILLAVLVYGALSARQRRQEIADRLNRLAVQAPGMLYQLRVHGDGTSAVPYVSERIAPWFGLAQQDVEADATPLWDRVDDADIDEANARLRESIATDRPWHQRLRMRDAEGRVRWFQTDASPDREPSGDVVMHGYLVDVTEEMAVEEQLRISASVFDSTRDGVIIMTADARITEVNAGFTALTGYTLDDVRGKTLEVLGSDLTPQDVYDDVRSSLDREGFWRGELINRSREGRVEAQAVTVSSVTDEMGELSHLVAVVSALSALRDDLVTGLPGRQMVDDRLTQAVERARASRSRTALMVIGLDRFQDVNEALGHRVGDLVLKESALRLRQAVREPETVARLGGDEFAVILSADATPEVVEGTASRITRLIAEPFRLGGRDLHLTASIGIAVFPDDAQGAADLLTAASQAMRAAKESGRDRYGYFTSTMQEQARQRTRLTEDLRHAVRDGQLSMVYQPVVDLSSGEIVKAEALVRWTHPELGPISPVRFIPLAEASGQVKEIGDWIFARVLDTVDEARRLRPGFAIGFNLSPAEMHDPSDLHIRRLGLMQDRGLPGSALVAEITEGLLLDKNEITARCMAAYRAAGVDFAIDDFGTGYSSLSYLQSLDVDFLKIDQSFVAGLEPENGSHAVCVAIIDMAHALDLKVIAEGVETEVQRDLLVAAGCDFAQGFLFSRPIPPADLLALLRT